MRRRARPVIRQESGSGRGGEDEDGEEDEDGALNMNKRMDDEGKADNYCTNKDGDYRDYE